jgi:hypothetical protein
MSDATLEPFDCPILLIAFRRPHCIRQVIDAIRPYRPTHIFVACDGPKDNDDIQRQQVTSTRNVIDQGINWPCTIKRLYSDVNLGCSVGPICAISWFFDNVEFGIILEDDCVPHPDFLPFCANLLHFYCHDTRMWCISGSNFQKGLWRGSGSYYFTQYTHSWGWATWRRCWQNYDPRLLQWPHLCESGLMESLFDDYVERLFWSRKWQETYELYPSVSWWDYQWTFCVLINGGLTILPNRNLINNVGFCEGATHTSAMTLDTNISHAGVFPLSHPEFIVHDSCADKFTFDYAYNGASFRASRTFLGRLRAILSKVKSFFRTSYTQRSLIS